MRPRLKSLIQSACVVTRGVDLLQPVLSLGLRLYIANIFFKSGLVKISDWGATLALFRDEYQVPVLPPALAAVMGAGGELVFSLLLILGLAGRFSAMGLFFVNVMAVLSYPQLFMFECPAAIHQHFFWGILIGVLVVFGPGKWSVDHWVLRRSSVASSVN